MRVGYMQRSKNIIPHKRIPKESTGRVPANSDGEAAAMHGDVHGRGIRRRMIESGTRRSRPRVNTLISIRSRQARTVRGPSPNIDGS